MIMNGKPTVPDGAWALESSRKLCSDSTCTPNALNVDATRFLRIFADLLLKNLFVSLGSAIKKKYIKKISISFF